MKKRGLSAVIVTTLVILISLALIGILTALALPFVKENIAKTATTTAAFTIRLVALEDSILVQQPTIPPQSPYETRLIVRRDRGAGNLTGFAVRLKDLTNQEYTTLNFDSVSLDEFESYNVVFDHTLGANVSLLTLIPLVSINGEPQMLASAAVSYGIDYRGRFSGVANDQPITSRAACEDGGDNDWDGFCDFSGCTIDGNTLPADPGCTSNTDATEETQCQDDIDNELIGDGWIDLIDPGCADEHDDDETNSGDRQCSDGADNDGDLLVDGNDPDCASPDGDDESGNIVLTPLFLVQEQVSDNAWNSASIGIAERSFTISGNFIDCDRDGNINQDTIQQCITGPPQGQQFVQCRNSSGALMNVSGTNSPNIGNCNIPSGVEYIGLDMETPWALWLRNENPGSVNYERAQDEMVRAIEAVHGADSDLKVGIYPFPMLPFYLNCGSGNTGCQQGRNYYHLEAPQSLLQFYMDRSLGATRVFSAIDFASPDFYDSYRFSGNDYLRANEIAAVQNIMSVARTGAPNKPILPYIWYRFNPGDYLYSLVPNNELNTERVEVIMASGGRGVIWWGADRYYMQTAYLYPQCSTHPNPDTQAVCVQLRNAFDPELSSAGITNPVWPSIALDNYLDQLHQSYLQSIAEGLT